MGLWGALLVKFTQSSMTVWSVCGPTVLAVLVCKSQHSFRFASHARSQFQSKSTFRCGLVPGRSQVRRYALVCRLQRRRANCAVNVSLFEHTVVSLSSSSVIAREVEAPPHEKAKARHHGEDLSNCKVGVEPSKQELWSFPVWPHGCLSVFFVRGQRKSRSSALRDVLSVNCNDDR